MYLIKLSFIFAILLMSNMGNAIEFDIEKSLKYKIKLNSTCSDDIRDEAFKKARKSCLGEAESGDLDSAQNIAYLYLNGLGGSRDEKESFKWTKVAANKGVPRMMNVLAYYYQNGIGVEKNIDFAWEWYRKSAKKGFPDAFFNLGILYEAQGDYARAADSYSEGYEKGDYTSATRLAVLYVNGKGVEQDIEKAYVLASIGLAGGDVKGNTVIDFIEKRVTDKNREILRSLALSNLESLGLTKPPKSTPKNRAL